MEYVILFGLLAVLLAIGAPVAFSLLAATLATVLYLALPPIVVCSSRWGPTSPP